MPQDKENPEWTAERLAAARPAKEVLSEAVLASFKSRGPQKAPTKKQVSIRLDVDVIQALQATGPKWQTKANALLRKAVIEGA